jgi:hypothetical protein
MNNEHIYRSFMEQAFENHNRNITSAIAHVYTFQSQLPADFMKANHELTTREKNEIIRDILYPF